MTNTKKNKKIDDNYEITIKEKRKAAKILATIKLAKTDFWYFCKAMDENFFTNNKKYLRDLADELTKFYNTKPDVLDTLIINMPPRTGKTYILELYEVWCKCKNTKSKSIIVCYNELLSLTFSKAVRNLISTQKINRYKIIPSDIFRNVNIKKGSASQRMWSMEDATQVSFLATSPGGTVTGMAAGGKGGNIIIDDLVKNAYEAYNERILEDHWNYFTMTLASRREAGSKLIICFTRWSPIDLVGRYEDWAQKNNKKYKKIIYKMENEDGSPLDESIMTKKEMQERKKLIGDLIWNGNYQQEPSLNNDYLYTQLRAYARNEQEAEENNLTAILPPPNSRNAIYAVCDTADSGNDYTCAIAFTVFFNKIYILDVLYTQEKMEIVEEKMARFLHKNEVRHCTIEANAGGKGFARNVDRILKQDLNNNFTEIETFTQTKNKEARIFSNASDVQRLIYFPFDYFLKLDDVGNYIVNSDKQKRDFIEHIQKFVSVKDSDHDDAEDALTLVVEFAIKNGLVN